MKRLSLFFSFSILFISLSIIAIPYIVRQPKTYPHVVKGVHYQVILSPDELNKAFDMEHRQIIQEVLAEAQLKPSYQERIRTLQGVNRVSFEHFTHARLIDFFKNLSQLLFYISKTTVNVFDQLLPSVNLLHNYFALLENTATGENKKLFTRLNAFFRESLLGFARERYAEGEYFKREGLLGEWHNRIIVAQALVYRLQDTDPRAMHLFKELDTFQPVPFVKELKEMGVMATGGMQ